MGDPATATAREVERLGRDLVKLREQVEQLADGVARVTRRQGAASPAPSWIVADDPASAGELLRGLYDWLDAVYLRYPDTALPTCWQRHPWAVEELLWLRAAHTAAYDADSGTVSAAADWHDKHRPGVTGRIRSHIGSCNLHDHRPRENADRPDPTAPQKHLSDPHAFAWTHDRSQPDITDHDLDEATRHEEHLLITTRTQTTDTHPRHQRSEGTDSRC